MLFEHAAGYALFKVREFEEIGMNLPQVEASTTDISRFNQVIKLIAFSPFASAAVALENINSISEGKIIRFYSSLIRLFYPIISKLISRLLLI